ncbi:MAG: hypothetical protein EZS28_002047 [Streblomastix strix]|uniref:Uncharacterized protein n=1 Tax=Streblomastix strix TaxID=222440 RepID=A0A5J4X7A6_9EUKA|nr:MAG: hypothetical protein EZS28_002047 [Streblomastix strix]
MLNVDEANGLSASITYISASNRSLTRSRIIAIMLLTYSMPFLANTSVCVLFCVSEPWDSFVFERSGLH